MVTITTEAELLVAPESLKCSLLLRPQASKFSIKYPLSLCGVDLLVDGSQRRATLGGTIIVNNKYYGLTVAHVFAESSEQQARETNAETSFYDSDGNEESNSDTPSDRPYYKLSMVGQKVEGKDPLSLTPESELGSSTIGKIPTHHTVEI